jgi:uncharacterized membrane protein YfcA
MELLTSFTPDELNYIYCGLFFLTGIGAFILSTIAGGGGSLILLPIISSSLGASQAAPVLNLGAFIGRPSRMIIFWKHIHWQVCLYYAPPAILGAYVGALLFSNFKMEWLQILIGVFLISTLWQYRFGKKKRSFEMKLWYFFPLGLIVAVLGTVVGAMGPILNPFYLNLGLDKEDLIATKTANSFILGISQVSSYAFFGLLHDKLWIYGLFLGIGATIGNIIGKRYLQGMKSISFRRWVVALMVISGVMLLLKQFI